METKVCCLAGGFLADAQRPGYAQCGTEKPKISIWHKR